MDFHPSNVAAAGCCLWSADFFQFASIFKFNLVPNLSTKVAMGWARFGLVLGLFHGPFGLVFGSGCIVEVKRTGLKLF